MITKHRHATRYRLAPLIIGFAYNDIWIHKFSTSTNHNSFQLDIFVVMLQVHHEYWQVDYSEKDTCKEIRVQGTIFLPIVLKREVSEI
jgi:hypothetical protein